MAKFRPLILSLFIIFFIIIRVVPVINNNFFFTADQGRDAVFVREILTSHRLFLQGPETTIRGIFTLPLWYYFIALGYFLTGGHPVGGIIILIFINLFVAIYLARFFNRPILIFALSFFWGYYQASRFAFNPFPLVPLSILLIIFSSKYLSQKKHLWSLLIIVFLAANTHLVGAIIFAIFLSFIFILRLKKINFAPDYGFVYLSILLSVITIILLSFSPIQRDWYSVFLPSLAYISIILISLRLPRLVGSILLSILFIICFFHFSRQYLLYLRPSVDRSVLSNQLKAIDWVYQHSQNQGFNVYTYTDSFYDYSYQYLFWWYGLKKYGYLPQEYSHFPSAGKEYIPGIYSQPFKENANQIFVISDSKTNGNDNSSWLSVYQKITTLTEQSNVGQIHLEKRLLQSPYFEYTNKNIIYRQYLDYGLTVKIPEYWQSLRQPNQLIFENPTKTILIIAKKISSLCPTPAPTEDVVYIRKSGPKNDFLLSIKASGIMIQANELISIITNSFKSVEDSRAAPVYNCD